MMSVALAARTRTAMSTNRNDAVMTSSSYLLQTRAARCATTIPRDSRGGYRFGPARIVAAVGFHHGRGRGVDAFWVGNRAQGGGTTDHSRRRRLLSQRDPTAFAVRLE